MTHPSPRTPRRSASAHARLLIVLTLLLPLAPALADVRLTDGAYHQTVPDLSVKALGGQLTVQRTWFEGRWQINRRWNPLSIRYDPLDGTIKSIQRNGDDYAKADQHGRVFRYGKRRFIFVTATGLRWQDRRGNWIDYDPQGRLLAYGDRNDVQISLVYDPGIAGRVTGVLDHHGRQALWYDYDPSGQLIGVHDATGRAVGYHYQGGRIQRVTDVLGFDWTYQYDGQGRLSTKTDPADHSTTIAYNATGMVSRVTDPDNHTTTYSYADDKVRRQFYVQVKTPAGRVDEYWYDREGYRVRHDRNGNTRSQLLFDGRDRIPIDSRGERTLTEMDEWDNPLSVTYPDGSSISTRYDRWSNPLEQTDENGVVTRFDYDEHGNLLRRIEAAGTAVERLTEYTYDAYGQALSETRVGDDLTATATVTVGYDANGNAITVTDAEGHTTTASYDVMGKLLNRSDPRNNVWTRSYDAAGRLITDTNPLGQATTYAYDKVGNLTRTTDPRGHATSYRHDARDNRIQTTDALGHTTTRSYDADNRLTTVTEPGPTAGGPGLTTRYDYDRDGRLTAVEDAAGDRIELTYGDQDSGAGNDQISRIDYPTYAETYRYDRRGRRIATDTHLGDDEVLTTTTTHDPAGNPIATTDTAGRITAQRYDALDRLFETLDPAHTTVQYHYDNRDNLLGVTNQNDVLIRRFTYDRNGQKTAEIWPEGETTTYVYDSNGNLAEKTDAKGQVTRHSYDPANRLSQTTYHATESTAADKTVTYGYDENGNRTAWDDGRFNGTTDYDELDRSLGETIDYGPFIQSYQQSYTPAGDQQTFTGPDGKTLDYRYDPAGRLQRIDIPGQGSISVLRYRWSVIEQIQYPGGYRRTTEHDALLRPTHIQVTDVTGQQTYQDYRYDYDAAGNIDAKHTEHGSYHYGYDSTDRLTQVDNPTLPDEAYSYDGAGNRLTDISGDTWAYNDADQLLGYGDNGFAYDANGSTVSEGREGQTTQTYDYNLENRLSHVTDGDGSPVAAYHYDPMGRRLSKRVGDITTYYLYAEEGLIAELDKTGSVQQGYGWLPDTAWGTAPLFTYTEAEYGWYLNDHLGTPQKVLGTDGVIAWEATYNAFGEAFVGAGAIIPNQSRYPGQHFDLETGLHYNFFRDFQPTTGRYIQSDPIGLLGGINTFQYGKLNPNRFIDPEGEKAWKVLPYLAWICKVNKKLCVEAYKCIKSPSVCKKRFCRIARSKTLYHPFCDVAGCHPQYDIGSKDPGRRDEHLSSAEFKLTMAQICLALREFVTEVCYDGKADKDHANEIDIVKEKIRSCKLICRK